MKKIIIGIISFFILIYPISANTKETVKFSRCVDGDTIEVIQNGEKKKVRFLAIDTPETKHPKKGEEPYGKEASEFTCNHVKNANVLELEYDDGSEKTDKYGRLLAWVLVDGRNLNDLLVKEGLAEVAYLYGDYKYTSLLKDHQAVAQSQKLNLWSDKIPEEKPNLDWKIILLIIVVAILLIIFEKPLRKWKRKTNKLKRNVKKVEKELNHWKS